jgi:hypothetical protein
VYLCNFNATLNVSFLSEIVLRLGGRLEDFVAQHINHFSENMKVWQLVYEDGSCFLCS